MKKSTIATFAALLVSLNLLAQEQVTVGGHDVGTWFKNNWMWITGGVILLLIIIMAMSGRGRRKTTTVVKDEFGNVKTVTRTEKLD